MAKNNLVKIGGELKSVAADGVVAGAEAIYDYTEGKSQAVINQDLKNAIEDIDVTSQISDKEDKSNKVTSFSSPTDTQYPSAKLVNDQLATKQNIISDLSTIRSGASAGATAYQKPEAGIPPTDFTSAVQTSLSKADTAIQSVTVGTTTTGAAGTNASVTNTGTATAPVLSFTIPQGAQGVKGDTVIIGGESSYTLYNTTGDAVDGAMTQQAVTRELTELEEEVTETYGSYIEDTQFIKVVTDAEGRILYGVKTDGEFVFGVGVPQSIKDYVLSQKTEVDADVLAEKTRAMAAEQALSTNKVDKEEGKGLIPTQYIEETENPEFVKVVLDNDGKILYGVKANGSFYFGAGVPQQVKDYIEEKIFSLSLDEHDDIVAFLNDYLDSDTTLKAIIDEINATKVSEEEGKSLIDSEYASTKSNIENPEYLTVWVDQNDKVVFGLRTDGKTYIGDANFFNDIKNNQEAIAETNTTLATIGAKVDSLDIDALSSITTTENPEYIEAKLDSEDKIVEATKVDGTKVIGGNLEIGGGMKIGGNVTFISGIPQEIIDYVEANTGSGVSDIEYEDETGDMYATYDDADGVTDVYMDENGDIYAEIEE